MNEYKITFKTNSGLDDYIIINSENESSAKNKAELLLSFLNDKKFILKEIKCE